MKTTGELPPPGEAAQQITEIKRAIEHLERHMTPLWHVYKYSYEHMTRIEQRHSKEDVTQAPRLRTQAITEASYLMRFAASEIREPRPGVAPVLFLPSTFQRLEQEPNFDELHWIIYGGKHGAYRLEVLRVQLNSQYQEDFRPPPLLEATEFTIRGYDMDNPDTEEAFCIVNGRPYIPFWYEDAALVYPQKRYFPAEALPGRILAFWLISRLIDEQEWPGRA